MTSGELGQSSGSDLYCSVVQAVTTGHQYVLPSQVWLLTAWKSTCKREILVERKVAYNQNASNLEREWIQWLPKPNSEDSAWLWEFLKGKGEVLSGGHWDGRSELLPSPTACRLLCRFINFLWFSLYAIVFTQFVCGITAGKAREEIWSPDNYLFLISVSLIYGKNQQIRWGASLVAQMVKNLPAMQETWVWSLGWEDPLEKGMATHFSILAWRIPMDRGAWWATVHGLAKSWTETEWLTLIVWSKDLKGVWGPEIRRAWGCLV